MNGWKGGLGDSKRLSIEIPASIENGGCSSHWICRCHAFKSEFLCVLFSPRRSVEERPGTPTIDEHNHDVQSAPLPDTSVPPPNFPPGEEPPFTTTAGSAVLSQPHQQPLQHAAQPIETLGARFQHRMPVPHAYRGEHPYGPIRYDYKTHLTRNRFLYVLALHVYS
jgi:hypothetical protein